jgi:hypothetical protein
MLDLRSAAQLVGVILVARVFSYLLVRLIEGLRPRPVHFIVAAPILRDDQPWSGPEDAPLEAEAGPTPSENVPDVNLVGLIVNAARYQLAPLRFFIVNSLHPRRRKFKKRFSLKLITEIIGLLTAGISLVALVLECFFKRMKGS